MAIAVRDGKYAYIFFVMASRLDVATGVNNQIINTLFDVADSDEEAEGRAMRVARLRFPQRDGWHGHFAMVKCISKIDWIGRADYDKITPYN